MNRRDALSALMGLPSLTRISRANLEPHDVLVFELAHYASLAEVDKIKEMAEAIWPGRKVVVLSPDVKLKIVAGS